MPLPPLEEQRVIVAFLEKETERINALIAKKERQIELLKEKRAALISHAVTKGLNPNAKMKDSCINWLGEVPSHWHHRKLGYITEMVGGSTPEKSNDAYWNGTIPWVSPKDMKRRQIDNSEDHVTEAALDGSSLRIVEPPAVLIVVRGMILAHTFPVAVTNVPLTINQDMKALIPKRDYMADYIAYLLEGIGAAMLAQVEDSAHGTKCLRTDLWRNTEIYLPDENEQVAICSRIKQQSGQNDKLLHLVTDSVSRLHEYHSALISAAVTGKIDVRQEVT